MVHRTDFLFNEKHCRDYPAPPIETRVKDWLERKVKTTARYPRPYRLQMRQKHATELGLPDSWVEIREDGSLWHASREEAIAKLDTTS